MRHSIIAPLSATDAPQPFPSVNCIFVPVLETARHAVQRAYALSLSSHYLLPMTVQPGPSQPSLPWRASSTAMIGFVGSLSRVLMYGTNRPEIHGLDRFRVLLDERSDPRARKRGLITGEKACGPGIVDFWLISDGQYPTTPVCEYAQLVLATTRGKRC